MDYWAELQEKISLGVQGLVRIAKSSNLQIAVEGFFT